MENRNTAPVGVFDSGVGGLTVAREISRQLPNENIVYFGDTARVPYGSKSQNTIIRFSEQIIRFLKTKEVKAIVIACNTASALALDAVRGEFDVPVMGVVIPGARAAVEATRNRKVGVVGTDATVQSGMYTKIIHGMAPDIEVIEKACPLFVPLVEEALKNGEDLLVIMAHGGTQMAIMERFALPHYDYYHWCGPNAGGYVLEAEENAWRTHHTLLLTGTVQYTKEGGKTSC